MELMIAQLRKRKGVSQQQLADYLGVTYQAVSKWETKAAMPDITLLPEIAKYFDASVDEILGLVPLYDQSYIPRNTDDRSLWKKRERVIKNDRMFFWNDDYLNFLIHEVWKIDKAVDLCEFGCCDGDLGIRMLKLLPEGSTYTGIDSAYLIETAKQKFQDAGLEGTFIESNLYSFESDRCYDICICQAVLRHSNEPLLILKRMKQAAKHNGLVICVEINRELENAGIYADGMDYEYLCTAFDWRRLWMKELEKEGRDYAIGFRLPFYMKQIGLKHVDIRMNDRMTLITPDMEEFEQYRDSLAAFRGWIKEEQENKGGSTEFLMSRGYKRSEVEDLGQFQHKMYEYMKQREKFGFLHFYGFIISYGRK